MLQKALLLFFCPLFLFAENKDATIVMQFADGFSPQALQEMQLEAERLVRKAGVNIAFKHRAEASQQTYNDIVFSKCLAAAKWIVSLRFSTNVDPSPSPLPTTDASCLWVK